MQKKIFVYLSLAVLALAITACSGTAMAQTPPASTPATRTLSVTGTGKVYVTPDIATISVGVRSEEKDAAEAVASNNAQAKRISQALVAKGVDEKDIQTSSFSIYPQQQYDDQGNLVGTTYVVENTVYVTVRDLDKLGELLDAVIQAGANNIYGIQFDVEDRESALTEARQKAVDNAEAQAQELAQAAGVTLGELQTISTYSSGPVPVFEGKGGGAADAAASTVPISPGQLSVTADVSVVYAIE